MPTIKELYDQDQRKRLNECDIYCAKLKGHPRD